MAQKVSASPFWKFKFTILSGFLFILLLGFILWSNVGKRTTIPPSLILPTTSYKQSISQSNSLTYSGKEGIDALTLLKEKTAIQQDRSGLVVSINKRQAEASKKEYWSFFVNGKMAEVGPAAYVTHDGDTIEWKIQTY